MLVVSRGQLLSHFLPGLDILYESSGLCFQAGLRNCEN